MSGGGASGGGSSGCGPLDPVLGSFTSSFTPTSTIQLPPDLLRITTASANVQYALLTSGEVVRVTLSTIASYGPPLGNVALDGGLPRSFASTGTSIVAGTTDSLTVIMLDGGVTQLRAAAVASIAAVPGSDLYLVNSRGVGDLDALDGGPGLYSLRTTTLPRFGRAAVFPEAASGGGVTSVTSAGTLFFGPTRASDQARVVRVASLGTWLGPVLSLVGLSGDAGLTTTFVGADLDSATTFLDSVVLVRVDTGSSLATAGVQLQAAVDGGVSSAQLLVPGANRCTEVTFASGTADTLLIGLRDALGHRVVRFTQAAGSCPQGFVPQGGGCDLNECLTPNICGVGATCTNLPGSYSCTCTADQSVVNGACVPSWVELTTGARPASRIQHAMTYDPIRRQVVLFGGRSNLIGGPLDDTWVLDSGSTSWRQLSPPNRPSPRTGHTMAFDTSRGVVVLFGGAASSNSFLNDTWEWNGTNWTQATNATGVSARSFASMAFDPAGTMVLTGGGNGSSFAETFVRSSGPWMISGSTPWAARAYHSTVFHAGLNAFVLFGGCQNFSAIGQCLADTFTRPSGSTAWTAVGGAAPAARGGAASAFDSRSVMIFGGTPAGLSNPLGDTWTFDGASWTSRAPMIHPPGRSFSAAAFDLHRNKVVLFGGGVGVAASPTQELWEFTP